jgi:tetratricopeptide (TPR) repeat protein
MKSLYITIFLGFTAISLFAQDPFFQNGVVREQNSGKRPVPEVQIIFSQAAPTTSDGAGKFKLAFVGKKAGDLVFMTEITKKGYELVNDKELEHVKLSSTEQLGTDIIVAKAGVIEAAKKEYYAISDKALKAGFEKQKALLRSELSKAQLSEKQYQDQYEALQKQYENQRKELDNLSEKFAKVNFDDVSPLYQEALQLFREGKIEEAIQKLEGADLMGRTDKRLKERERIAKENAINEKGIQEDIKSLKLQANLYILKFDIAKAEVVYERMLLLDSTNLNIQRDVAEFYRENHRYEKALRLYPKIIAHPQAEDWQKAKAYRDSGDMLTNIGQFNNALYAFLQYKNIHEGLLMNNPNAAFSKQELSVAHERLGKTHTTLGNLDKAYSFFEEMNKLCEELYATNPTNVDFKKGLAVSYQKLGDTHTTLGNLDKAYFFFEEMNRLFNELYAVNPTNVEFKKGLAISCQYLGNSHTSLGDLPKALGFFDEMNKLFKELYVANPTNVDFKKGLAISYEKLGETHKTLGHLDKSLEVFIEYNRLAAALYAENPTNVEFKKVLATSYQYLGNSYTSLGDLSKALGFFEEMNKLLEELYVANPTIEEYKKGLAISYEKLGETYTSSNNWEKALDFFEKDIKLSKELHEASPTNVDFKNGLALSYQYVGNTLMSSGNLIKALGFYEEYNRLEKELYVAYPTTVAFKNGLAISCYKLGEINMNLKNKPKAKTYFEQAKGLWQELVHDVQPNLQFQKFLDKVQSDLNTLNTPPSIFELETSGTAKKQIADYTTAIAEAKSYAEKAAPQSKLVTVYENLLKTYKGNKQDSSDLSDAYSNLAWDQLFNKQFSAAEQSARRGLALDASHEWINANLAVALLYKGKWKAAKTLYLSLKDKPFNGKTYKEVFLSDLDELEKAGILHADMAKIRALLKK